MKRLAQLVFWALCLLPAAASSQAYPSRPVRLIVPYAPGGGTDAIARVLAVALSDEMHASIFVENRPGASSVIGTDYVLKSAPDGYTLVLISSAHAANASLYASIPFDAVRDIAPVSQVAYGPSVIVVNARLEAQSLQELIALARRKPGELTFGSGGVGNPPHLGGELLQRLAHVKLTHVPYKGSGQSEIALVAGEISMIVDSIPPALPFIRAGRTRPLAVTGKQRFPLLPNVPTTTEAGLDDFDISTWWGIIGPKGMPAATVDRLNAAVGSVLRGGEVRDKLLQFGAQPAFGPPKEFGGYIRAETERYTRLIKELNIPPIP